MPTQLDNRINNYKLDVMNYYNELSWPNMEVT